MQTVHATLLTRLRDSATDPTIERRPADLYEFYAHDYIPDPVLGFEPADAVETFAAIDITWNGIAYRREVVSRSSIDLNMGAQTNSCTITFSAVDGYLPTWANSTTIEGMWVVIRYIERDITAGSLVRFVGKAGKPGTVNNKTFPLPATQDVIDLNAELPLRNFSAQDPEGRSPADPHYEGIRFVAIAGSLSIPTIIPAQNTIARLFGQRDTIYVTKQWSSHDATPEGNPIREVLGRAQVELLPFLWADKGVQIAMLAAACAGPIQAIEQIKTRTSGWSDLVNSFNIPPAPVEIHLGDLGGTGTNAAFPIGWPTSGLFSHLAYVSGSSIGSTLEQEDSPPTVTALVIGRRVPTPNGSGVYPSIAVESTLEWTDNPVHLARWIFLVSGVSEEFMEDSVNYLTSLWCDEPLLDESNDERAFVLAGDLPQTGTGIVRLISSGVLNPRFVRYWGGDPVDEPWLTEPVYETYTPDVIPSAYTVQKVYRKRYTFNAPIAERVKTSDFLNKVLYPAARLWHKMNAKGKVEIHSEKASDNCILRAATIATATQLLVDDATPWKENLLLQGKLLIGGTIGLTTSEVRRVSTATYTTDGNAITLTAGKTGAVTATASGATLTGGSTTVQASGTVTIGGTPGAGDTVTTTIGGIAVIYTVVADETTASVAAMIAYAINADTRLKRFIKATSSGAVVTVRAKYGILNLDAALVNAHTGPRAAPVSGPTLGASAGAMAAGTYKVAYAYVTSVGRTTISPTTSQVLTANQKIDVTSLGALPGGVLSVNWYVSAEPNVDKLVYYDNNAGGAFSITALPSKDNPGAPAHNTTGEECIRVAMSFATNTQGATILAQAGLTRGNANDYNYPLGSEQSSINQIKGSFRDAKNDFALTPFTVNDPVHQLQLGSGGKKKIKPLEVDYSGVDNWHQAFRLANSAISKNREGDWFNSLSTANGEALLLDEGDLLTASDASGGLINVVTRIEAMSISPTWEVSIRKARKYSTLMFSDDVRQHDIPLPSNLRYVATADTQFVPMDLPYWRDTDSINQLGFHLALARSSSDGDWKGSAIHSDASGAYVAITQKIETQVPIGDALTAMSATTNTYTIDTVSTVRIQIVSPFGAAPLVSTTEDLMKAGANKYALGVNGRWEIGHFQTATLVGGTDDTWDLTVHLRGRHGTEHNTSNHTTDDEFVLLTDATGNDTGVQFIPLDYALLAKTFNLKAVTTNQDEADATAESFTWEGEILRPLTVINENGERDSDDSLLIEFEGRTRFAGGLRAYQGGAVNEEQELYKVQILNGGSPILPNGSERVMNVIVGMTQAALLESNGVGKYDKITANTLDSGVDFGPYTAVSFQKIQATGNRIDATLSANGGFGAGIGIVPESFNWRTATQTQIKAASQIYALFFDGGPPSFEVLEYNVSKYTLISPSGSNRVTMIFSGSEVRVYRNWTGPNSVPVYISPKLATFPLMVIAFVEGTVALVSNITMTTSPYPKTIYSEAQQIEDFGSVQDPVEMEIYQDSALVGDGQRKTVVL